MLTENQTSQHSLLWKGFTFKTDWKCEFIETFNCKVCIHTVYINTTRLYENDNHYHFGKSVSNEICKSEENTCRTISYEALFYGPQSKKRSERKCEKLYIFSLNLNGFLLNSRNCLFSYETFLCSEGT